MKRNPFVAMPNRQDGLTIIEMMIALVIVGVVMTIVVPSAQSLLNQNRVIAEINEVSGVIQFARANAIDEQVETVICPTEDFSTCTEDWTDPKMVFADEDASGTRNNDEELLVATSALSSANTLSGPAVAIQFDGNGIVNGVATLLLCHSNDDANLARELYINAQGRVKISRDSNKDGVHESHTGGALSCS